MLFSAFICGILAACLSVVIFNMIPDIKAGFAACRAEKEEIKKALDEIKIAEQQFNCASDDYVDVAIYRLKAATARFNSLIKEQKRGCT